MKLQNSINSKIIILYDKLIATGGAERLAVNFFYYLRKNNYDVEFLTFEISNGALFNGRREDFTILKNWFEFRKVLKKNRESIFIIDSGFIKFKLASVGINLKYFIHLHHPLFMSFNDMDKFSLIHRKNYKKYKLSNFGAESIVKPNFNLFRYIYINLRALLFYHFINKALGVLVLSKYSQKEKKDLFNIESKVLRGALDEVKDYNPAKFKDLKIIKLLMVGRLDKNKRIDLLIDAINDLKDKKIKISLDIVGHGPEYKDLQRLSHNLGLSNIVNFHGFVNDNDLFKIYSDSHIFISLDWADYKITMYEALNQSCFVIVTNETEIEPKIMNSGRVVVMDLKKHNLSKKIINLIQSKVFTKNHSNKILSLVLWDKYFEDNCNYFREILNNLIVNKFNLTWQKALTKHFFYREWKSKYNLPSSIKSISDLNKWPKLNKKDIQNLPDNLFKKFNPVSTTGGSSGKPLKIPSSHSQKIIEKNYSKYFRNKIIGSNNYKIILIWGHSHLFGLGFNYIINKFKRIFLDFIYGYERISAYLSNDKIYKKLQKKLKKNKEILIIGYSKILFNLINSNKNLQINNDNISYLFTAEGLSKMQKNILSRFKTKNKFSFEYGMAEFNAIAFKKGINNSSYYYNNNNFILQKDSNDQLLITSVYDREFPLIRYESEDYVELSAEEIFFNDKYNFLPSFNDIIGRSNDFLELTNCGVITKVHSEYFTHALKNIKGLNEYRIIQKKDKTLEIYIDKDDVNNKEMTIILKRHLDFDNNIKIKTLKKNLKHSLAGKSKFITIEK